MMRYIGLLAVCLVVANATPRVHKIIGGSAATIEAYPFAATLLRFNGVNFIQNCAGTIINSRTILTSGRCVFGDSASHWRSRIGSALANSGGTVLNTASVIVHPSHNPLTLDFDVALLRTDTITFGATVAAASIAGTNYIVPDNTPVWAIGWGATSLASIWEQNSEQLQHVEVWTVNQDTCRERNGASAITDRMLCSGWLDIGGRGQCFEDFGGPLLHNNVVVGIYSWSYGCASANYPGVNARISSFTDWIVANA